ncbi:MULTISPECIES: YwqI/YxiC family protein [Oceanobacillus]|uniref:Uncharacterized protein n=1 Tax=Oceanobacillus kimchii TaxID=746691 RepID=A0ABQ5TPE5_9BACI|nr:MULTISPECIES: YwqI/YxiC family protein [Oceanobacillus]MBT2600432.1 YwqI/YxiC family protein [Oceanobacillus sp. ISL-74]MBT2650590.1 YwqI/YxiC family protein [Oceanobacillus sp. ISL-73]MCT1578331.1 YwqI/YxiC family protein [Oceanobacillus kimchii]MCT2134509.1 YwqI/YxiC family protein [Oceanobacillus kimchii]OEH54870.1 hypothetical protein AQ616_07415 [Oceanobacillus sp. E9]
MPEIKVDPDKVTPILNNLKRKTEDLETSNPNPTFSTSDLDFLIKIQSIEENYYSTLNNYKDALIKVESSVDEAVQAYVETDENLAKQIGPLPVK